MITREGNIPQLNPLADGQIVEHLDCKNGQWSVRLQARGGGAKEMMVKREREREIGKIQLANGEDWKKLWAGWYNANVGLERYSNRLLW